ncbi:hypothetical protein SK128_019786, partial [Halocaridina rubra]
MLVLAQSTSTLIKNWDRHEDGLGLSAFPFSISLIRHQEREGNGLPRALATQLGEYATG